MSYFTERMELTENSDSLSLFDKFVSKLNLIMFIVDLLYDLEIRESCIWVCLYNIEKMN